MFTINKYQNTIYILSNSLTILFRPECSYRRHSGCFCGRVHSKGDPNDLKAVAEDYRRKFGVYPKAILADKIYQTRANRSYCKERGIRLSGPVLGRPKSGEAGRKEARQTYKDSCERNAVEGRNGNLKRRYGLNLIMSKLDETAKTEAALNILAMNAAQWLRRWLLLIFKILALEVVFQ